jgi:magnesium transporter
MLINCAAYQDGRKLADIPIEDISEYVARPECFVWVALKDPGPDELAVMKEEFSLHELAVEDALHGHQRPKIEEYGESLFAVMHTVEMDDDNELLIGEVDVFVGSNYVLSVRHRTRFGFSDVRARCEREPKLLKEGAAFVLYALADDIVDRYFPILEALGAETEEVEDRIFDKNNVSASRAIIEDLYSLKRRLVSLQHHVAPLQEAISKLSGGRVPQVCAGMEAAIQVDLGMISLAESEVTKRLGSFAALFAVPTMIAGIYGMNFQTIPELHYKYGYPICLAVMFSVDLFLWWRFRKAGWL